MPNKKPPISGGLINKTTNFKKLFNLGIVSRGHAFGYNIS